MKAKKVFEHTDFKRNSDIKKSLSIGKRESIISWFNEYAPFVKYDIDDDDNFSVHITGNFYITNHQVSHFPFNKLVVGDPINLGSMNMIDTNITKLPDETIIYGNLWMEGSPVEKLPNKFTVRSVGILRTKMKGFLDEYKSNPNISIIRVYRGDRQKKYNDI